MPKQRRFWIGATSETSSGTPVKIVDFINFNNIVVEIQNKEKIRLRTSFSNFRGKTIKDPYAISVYGIGYLGVGKYKVEVTD